MGIDMSISCVECNEVDLDSPTYSESSQPDADLDLQLKEDLLHQLQLEQNQREMKMQPQRSRESSPATTPGGSPKSPSQSEKKKVTEMSLSLSQSTQFDDAPSMNTTISPLELPEVNKTLPSADYNATAPQPLRDEAQEPPLEDIPLEDVPLEDVPLEEIVNEVLSPMNEVPVTSSSHGHEICTAVIEELLMTLSLSEQLAPPHQVEGNETAPTNDDNLHRSQGYPIPDTVHSSPAPPDPAPVSDPHLLSSLSSVSQDSNDHLSPLPFSPLIFPPAGDGGYGDDHSLASSLHSRSTTRSACSSSSHSSKRTITCHRCQQSLPRHSFSTLQLQKKIHRLCKQCVSGDVYVL
jgi:hypothetical protein